MKGRFRLLLGSAITAMAAQGCSSSDSSPASPDSGDEGGGSCDAASLPLGGDAGACTACKAMKCATELAQCAGDCACAQIEVCLETNGPEENFSACPVAVSA